MSVYSYAWTTDFSTPATPSGLTVTPNTEDIGLDISWTASVDPYHYETLVEAQVGDGEWIEIGRSADETFTYYLVPLNTDVRIRVSDSNGALYSDTLEGHGELDFLRWAMTHVDGDADFVHELRGVRPQGTTDLPLDQVVLQPLSGPDGDTQLPIVFTGQWQGERIGFQIQIRPEDRFLIPTFRRAAKQPQGSIALKDPKGPVYLVQLGSFQITDLGYGQQLVAFTAIRVV